MSKSSPERSPGAALDQPTESQRRTALIAGVWFVITFVASIPALLLYGPVLNDTGYILGAGADTPIRLGALLEVITAIAGIATAVVLFPIVKRQSEAIALAMSRLVSLNRPSSSSASSASFRS